MVYNVSACVTCMLDITMLPLEMAVQGGPATESSGTFVAVESVLEMSVIDVTDNTFAVHRHAAFRPFTCGSLTSAKNSVLVA